MSDECGFTAHGLCETHQTPATSGALCPIAAAALQAKVEELELKLAGANDSYAYIDANYRAWVADLQARVRELEGEGADPRAVLAASDGEGK